MRNGLLTVMVLAALAFNGCGVVGGKPAELRKIESDYVVKAGDAVLPQAAIDFIGKQGNTALSDEQIKNITDNWSESALLAAEAKVRGMDKTGDYLWQLEQAKLNILTQLLMASLKEQTGKGIDDSEIKKFYDENQNYFNRPGKIHARHIIVPVSQEAGAAGFTTALEEIKRIREEASQPGADFTALAEKYNTGAYADRKGDLGWFGKDEMVEPIANAAFALNPGEISQPVKSQFGYHLVKVLAKDIQPLDEVKDDIRDELVKQKVDLDVKKLTEDLKKKYPVEVKTKK